MEVAALGLVTLGALGVGVIVGLLVWLAARRFYNGNVRAYNTRCATFPSNVVAAFFGFVPAGFFELRDPLTRQAPRGPAPDLSPPFARDRPPGDGEASAPA